MNALNNIITSISSIWSVINKESQNPASVNTIINGSNIDKFQNNTKNHYYINNMTISSLCNCTLNYTH